MFVTKKTYDAMFNKWVDELHALKVDVAKVYDSLSYQVDELRARVEKLETKPKRTRKPKAEVTEEAK